jgi:hypothetical protein
MKKRTYRAEFFTAADYALRDFQAGTPEEALRLARRFYDDDMGQLDFRSYDDNAGVDQVQIWDRKRGTLAAWESDDYRLRKAARDLLAALPPKPSSPIGKRAISGRDGARRRTCSRRRRTAAAP